VFGMGTGGTLTLQSPKSQTRLSELGRDCEKTGDTRIGGQSVLDAVEGGGAFARFGLRAVGFGAVGAGGIDFALRGLISLT
jgi:hypothetical protein